MAKNSVTLILEVDDKGTAKIKQFAGEAKRAMQDVGSTSKQVSDGISKSWLAIGAAVGAALYGIQRASRDFIEASNKQAKAVLGMETVMRSMGRYSSSFSSNLQDLASSLQSVTNFGDEVTLEGTKFLMTYGEITDRLMPRSIQAMQDLAALMGGGEGSVVSAANMLGKASMGMVGTLRRVGVTVDSETFRLKGYEGLLEQIEKQVSGQAKAMREATAGYEAIGNEISDTKEILGDMIKLAVGDTFERWAAGLHKWNAEAKENLRLAKERKELGEATIIYGPEFAGQTAWTGPTAAWIEKTEAEGAELYPEVDIERRERRRAQMELMRPEPTTRTEAESSRLLMKAEEFKAEEELRAKAWQAEIEAENAKIAKEKETQDVIRQLRAEADIEEWERREKELSEYTDYMNRKIEEERRLEEQKESQSRQERYLRQQGMSATLTDMQTIAQAWGSHNKALFAAFKAYAIAHTLISTYEGAQDAFKAMAGIPPAPMWGIIAAAVATAAGMARVQAIMKTKPQKAQRGGVFTEATLIEAGEAGPEAFVPLTGVNRRIPVEFSGGPGGDFYQITIYANDAASFQDMVTRNPAGVIKVVKELVTSGDRAFIASLREVASG